jgi:hypothetical protein
LINFYCDYFPFLIKISKFWLAVLLCKIFKDILNIDVTKMDIIKSKIEIINKEAEKIAFLK